VPEGPFFFLSYARGDHEGDTQQVIERFRDDLEIEVAARLGWSRPLGFMDSRSIDNGDDWSDELQAALGACCVFVPILSRTLFGREYCGREWAYFERRIDAAKQTAGIRPPLVQPVLLVGPHRLEPVPDVVSRVQNRGDEFPAQYNKKGLRTVMILREGAEYREFLVAFAERLVTVFEDHGAAPAVELPRIEDLPNAFHTTGGQAIATEDTSLRLAQFYYIAGRRDELASTRTYLDCYGDRGGADWRPYMPRVDQPVGLLASSVATEENLLYEWVRLDEDLIEHLDEAARTRTMVVLIVDPWTVRLPLYKSLMTELDQRNYPNTAVLVPHNPDDPELDRGGNGGSDVRNLFVNRVTSNGQDQFAHGIASPDELKSELARKLQTAKSRIEKQMQICRKASGDGPSSLPVIGDS
jgi:FxsC-like protein